MKIGPIPTDDSVGKEVITRITSDMVTNKVFYTDSNGRDFLKRVCQAFYCTIRNFKPCEILVVLFVSISQLIFQ